MAIEITPEEYKVICEVRGATGLKGYKHQQLDFDFILELLKVKDVIWVRRLLPRRQFNVTKEQRIQLLSVVKGIKNITQLLFALISHPCSKEIEREIIEYYFDKADPVILRQFINIVPSSFRDWSTNIRELLSQDKYTHILPHVASHLHRFYELEEAIDILFKIKKPLIAHRTFIAAYHSNLNGQRKLMGFMARFQKEVTQVEFRSRWFACINWFGGIPIPQLFEQEHLNLLIYHLSVTEGDPLKDIVSDVNVSVSSEQFMTGLLSWLINNGRESYQSTIHFVLNIMVHVDLCNYTALKGILINCLGPLIALVDNYTYSWKYIKRIAPENSKALYYLCKEAIITNNSYASQFIGALIADQADALCNMITELSDKDAWQLIKIIISMGGKILVAKLLKIRPDIAEANFEYLLNMSSKTEVSSDVLLFTPKTIKILLESDHIIVGNGEPYIHNVISDYLVTVTDETTMIKIITKLGAFYNFSLDEVNKQSELFCKVLVSYHKRFLKIDIIEALRAKITGFSYEPIFNSFMETQSYEDLLTVNIKIRRSLLSEFTLPLKTTTGKLFGQLCKEFKDDNVTLFEGLIIRSLFARHQEAVDIITATVSGIKLITSANIVIITNKVIFVNVAKQKTFRLEEIIKIKHCYICNDHCDEMYVELNANHHEIKCINCSSKDAVKVECPICLSSTHKMITLRCDHNFCQDCFIEHFCSGAVACAVCRRTVL